MDDEICQFVVSALKDMNDDVSEVTGETDLDPAGLAVAAGGGGE
jgi:hypothetical protein